MFTKMIALMKSTGENLSDALVKRALSEKVRANTRPLRKLIAESLSNIHNSDAMTNILICSGKELRVIREDLKRYQEITSQALRLSTSNSALENKTKLGSADTEKRLSVIAEKRISIRESLHDLKIIELESILKLRKLLDAEPALDKYDNLAVVDESISETIMSIRGDLSTIETLKKSQGEIIKLIDDEKASHIERIEKLNNDKPTTWLLPQDKETLPENDKKPTTWLLPQDKETLPENDTEPTPPPMESIMDEMLSPEPHDLQGRYYEELQENTHQQTPADDIDLDGIFGRESPKR